MGDRVSFLKSIINPSLKILLDVTKIGKRQKCGVDGEQT